MKKYFVHIYKETLSHKNKYFIKNNICGIFEMFLNIEIKRKEVTFYG